MASRLTPNQAQSLSSANKFDLTHILDGGNILEKLHIILEDGQIVKPRSNYVEELTKLFNDRSQVDDDWLRIGSNYIYFFSQDGIILPVIIVEPKENINTVEGESLAICLDQSSSMSSVNDAVYQGVKENIEEMPDDSYGTITTFSNTVNPSTRKSKRELLDTISSRVCKGTTALYDAIVHTISEELKNPMSRCTIVICTDGLDNASRSGARQEAIRLINQAQSIENWRVVFMGANQDAITVAHGLGIPSARALTFDAGDSQNVLRAFRATSENTVRYRSAGVDGYTGAQRVQSAQVSSASRGDAPPPPIRRQQSVL